MLWLCLRFPSLPLESATAPCATSGSTPDGTRHINPTVRDTTRNGRATTSEQTATPPQSQALAVIDDARAGSSKPIVLDCNDTARAVGIHPGMGLATAFSYLPALVCRPRDRMAERARLRDLAEFACAFSSQVSISLPDALLLEGARSLKLFGGLATLQSRIESHFLALGHHCDLGLAHTPLAAELLTRARIRLQSATPESVERALAHLPLHYTHWDARTLEQLQDSGLRLLGQVMALPPASLGRRHGPALTDYLRRLTGTVPDPRPNVVPREHFSRSLHLQDTLAHLDGLLFPMRRLVMELTAWARARQVGARAIAWHFAHQRHTPTVIRVSLAQATADPARLFDLSRLQLERAGALAASIDQITLRALTLEPLRESGDDLFSATARHHIGIHDLLDRIVARIGPDAVSGIGLADAHPPELGWQAVDPAIGTTTAADERQLRGRKRKPMRTRSPVHTSATPPLPDDRRLGSEVADKVRADQVRADQVRANEAGWLEAGSIKAGQTAAETAPRRIRPLWLLTTPRRIARTQLQLLRGPERIEIPRALAGAGSTSSAIDSPSPRSAQQTASRTTTANAEDQSAASFPEHPLLTAEPVAKQATNQITRRQRPAGQPPEIRDYYLARDRTGALCWVFVTASNQWHLHGYFG